MEDARATMGIYRLHRNDWERTSQTISKIQVPEPIDLWDVDDQSNTTFKRCKLAKQLGINIQTGQYSNVCFIPVLIVQELFIYKTK